MKLAPLVCFAALLIFIPPGSPLRCYICLFPTISPLDCLKFATPCGPAQKCLTSVTRGHRGALELVIHEKTCGDSSMCGIHGTRSMLGTNFTYHTYCCSTDLCNGAAGKLSAFWELLTLTPVSHPGHPLLSQSPQTLPCPKAHKVTRLPMTWCYFLSPPQQIYEPQSAGTGGRGLSHVPLFFPAPFYSPFFGYFLN